MTVCVTQETVCVYVNNSRIVEFAKNTPATATTTTQRYVVQKRPSHAGKIFFDLFFLNETVLPKTRKFSFNFNIPKKKS